MRPAAIRCTRCGADAAPAMELRPHEARYVEAHAADGEHTLFVCSSGHRMLLRFRAEHVAAALLTVERAQDATKPTEVELAKSIARAGLVR